MSKHLTRLALAYLFLGLVTHQPVQDMVRKHCPRDDVNALRYVALWPVFGAAVYNVTQYHPGEQRCVVDPGADD